MECSPAWAGRAHLGSLLLDGGGARLPDAVAVLDELLAAGVAPGAVLPEGAPYLCRPAPHDLSNRLSRRTRQHVPCVAIACRRPATAPLAQTSSREQGDLDRIFRTRCSYTHRCVVVDQDILLVAGASLGFLPPQQPPCGRRTATDVSIRSHEKEPGHDPDTKLRHRKLGCASAVQLAAACWLHDQAGGTWERRETSHGSLQHT